MNCGDETKHCWHDYTMGMRSDSGLLTGLSLQHCCQCGSVYVRGEEGGPFKSREKHGPYLLNVYKPS